MPIPTETLFDMRKLNRWFAISSLGLLASLVWMIWEDYDRPWRGVQDDYMVAQAALAHLDYLDTQTDSYGEKLAEAEKVLAAAREVVAARGEERTKLLAELRSINDRHYAVKIDYGNENAVLGVMQVHYEESRGAHGEDSPQAMEKGRALREKQDIVARLQKSKEELEDQRRIVTAKLKEIDADVTAAEKRLARLHKVADDAAKKENSYSNLLVRTIINMPLADFTAPKGTPARHEVRQLVLPDIRQELNYLQTYTTDRCTTCHVSIDDKNFTLGNLARRFERALPAIGEAMQREGLDPPVNPDIPTLVMDGDDEAPELVAGKVTEHWNLLSDEQRDGYFHDLLEIVNIYLEGSGRHPIKLGQPLLAHPNLDLFVNVDSPHPMSRIGCTVCHEGNPQETDFVQAAHTPVTHEQEHEWEKKHYVTAAFIPNVTFETIHHYWDRPMYPPKYAEAGCVKCHGKITDITSFRGESQATRINLGRDLFVRAGCINCHNVEDIGVQRKVGPDLKRVASKLSRDFAEQWIFHPKKFRPSTWMPHLFLQENNGPYSENPSDSHPVLRTETEVQAITEYIFAISQPYDSIPIPEGVSGDAKAGRKLFTEVGCLACHANLSEFGEKLVSEHLVEEEGRTQRFAEAFYEDMTYTERVMYLLENVASDRDTYFKPEEVEGKPIFTRHAPELSAIGSKVSQDWLFSWLKQPTHYNPNTLMPSLRLTDQEAVDLSAYLMTLRENEEFEIREFPDDEEHRQMNDDLVFLLLSGQNSERRSRDIMEDKEGHLSNLLVKSIEEAVGEEKARRMVADMDGFTKRQMYLGNKMVAHYGCYACHTIGGFETSPPPGTDLSAWGVKPLGQLDFAFFGTTYNHLRALNKEKYARIYPPEAEELIKWAHGVNPEESVTHTHAAFARHKMLNPRFWDRGKIKAPYDKLKMPNFYLTEDQADALVTFLLSRRAPLVDQSLKIPYDSTLAGAIADGRSLTRELNCVGCHRIEDNIANIHQYYSHNVSGRDVFDEVNAPPWLRGQGSKIQFPWLYGFFQNVETLRPWLKVRMPSFNLSEEETSTLVQYFAGITRQESEDLSETIDAIEDYIGKAHARRATEGDSAPDPDLWFATDALRDQSHYLASSAVKNRMVLKYDVDPTNSLEDLAIGYAEVLDVSRFTSELYDVRFPFADTPRPVVDDERFKLGEEFFYELKCLACHLMGDPNAEGANTNPSAPNLSLTTRRLRQEWVHGWLQEPGTIQPGTKMPQWFAKGVSAFVSYSEEDRAALEAKYGSTGEEQMQLLMDFIYNAGTLNYTALQPGGLSGGSAVSDDEGDDEEEEGDDEEDDSDEEEDEEEEDDED